MKTFDLAVESRNRDLVECLKPAALSLACREGDVNRVQSLINVYNCDPKGLYVCGLWYFVVDVCTCLVMGLWLHLCVKKFLSSVTYNVPGFIACCCLWPVVGIIHCVQLWYVVYHRPY